MGLFYRKSCDICGGNLGLLRNKKVKDGSICNRCAKKLSPWFTDYRNASLSEIKQQLAYREENKAKVFTFQTTRTLGTNKKVLIDEEAGKFMVTPASDLMKDNPDVLAYSMNTIMISISSFMWKILTFPRFDSS